MLHILEVLLILLLHCHLITKYFFHQGPSGDTGPAGQAGSAGPRVSRNLITHSSSVIFFFHLYP